MKTLIALTLTALLLLAPAPDSSTRAEDPARQQEEVTTHAQDHSGWIDLIGGELLDNWRQVNCADSTFSLVADAKDGSRKMIHCTGLPTGVLRTREMYENFVVEFEWRHMSKGWGANAGFFLWSDPLPSIGVPFTRSVEVQVANFDGNSNWYTRHGDVFPIHGATMSPDPRFGRWKGGARSLPLEFRAKSTAEWNHYRITCIDGTVQLEVNGRLVSGGYKASPRRGYLCIESEGGEVHFRAMRVLPLEPDARGLAQDQIATAIAEDSYVRPLYDGLGLDGWRTAEPSAWTAKDWILLGQPGGELARQLPPGDLELRLDWRFVKDGEGTLPAKLPLRLGDSVWEASSRAPGRWNRLVVQRAEGVWQANLNGDELPELHSKSDVLQLVVESHALEYASVLLVTRGSE